jgi:hypothetical protein
LVQGAASSGVIAATAINADLTAEDTDAPSRPRQPGRYWTHDRLDGIPGGAPGISRPGLLEPSRPTSHRF